MSPNFHFGNRLLLAYEYRFSFPSLLFFIFLLLICHQSVTLIFSGIELQSLISNKEMGTFRMIPYTSWKIFFINSEPMQHTDSKCQSLFLLLASHICESEVCSAVRSFIVNVKDPICQEKLGEETLHEIQTYGDYNLPPLK